MNKLNATLSEVLDVEPIGSTELLPATPITKVDDDADYARDNIRTLIEKGNLAVDGILHVAKESEQFSLVFYCIFAQFINNRLIGIKYNVQAESFFLCHVFSV